MYLLDVSPITRGSRETLSYFSVKPVETGSFVSIPLRKKRTDAVVLSSRLIRDEKAALKKIGFRLRKISPDSKGGGVSPALFSAYQRIADFFATSVGAVLHELTAVDARRIEHSQQKNSHNDLFSRFIVEGSLSARVEVYAKQIEEVSGSTLIIAPSHRAARQLEEKLSMKLSLPVSRLPQGSGKRMQKTWNDFVSSERGVFIGTHQLLSLARTDISLIVIDECGSGAYKARNRPFLDMCVVAEIVAKELSCPLIWGDSFVPTQMSGSLLVSTSEDPQKIEIVDLKGTGEKSDFQILSNEAVAAVSGLDPTSPVLIYTPRTGLFPLTVCRDCATVVQCPECSHPLVLHEENGKRVFRCHRCRKTHTTKIKCGVCESVQFDFLGIGMQAVEKTLQKLFPKHSVASAKDVKGSVSIVKDWSETGGILLAHEPALSLLPDPWPTTIVLTLDTLFSIPDIGMEDRIARLLMRFRQSTSDLLLIQNRNADNELLRLFLEKDSTSIRKELLAVHDETDTPPKKIFIRLTWPAHRPHEMFLAKAIQALSPLFFESTNRPGMRGRTANALFMMDPKNWPHPKVVSFLRALPPDISIDVSPASIL